jgi:hypothetical protein
MVSTHVCCQPALRCSSESRNANSSTTGTVSCSAYEVTEPLSGTRLTILDTPGFNDQTRSDLDILSEIASFLTSKNLPPIWAIVFTHAITENRVTGSSRLNLNIAKALCGERFYSRLALLTTMWNKMPSDEARELCTKRETQILTSPTFWGEMNERGCQHARFDGSSACGMDFLKQLLDLGQPSPGSFAYEQELRAGAPLEHTKAGAIIMAEREKRRKQLEEELQEEERNQRMEMEYAENARQRLSRNQGIDYRHDQELTMERPVVRRAPSGNDPMAYGQHNVGRSDRASAGPGQQMPPRTGRQPEPVPTSLGASFGSLRQWVGRVSR